MNSKIIMNISLVMVFLTIYINLFYCSNFDFDINGTFSLSDISCLICNVKYIPLVFLKWVVHLSQNGVLIPSTGL